MSVALAAAFLALSPAGAADGSPAAPWPERAEGRALPSVPWVLVVPARRLPGGELVIWDRADPWTLAWRVPRVLGGLRMVTLFGDAEDRRAVTPAAIDGMVISSLGVVQRKYGAPALALAVTDGEGVAVAGYVPGWPASWKGVQAGADAREAAVAALASMFGGAGGRGAAPDGGRADLADADPEPAPAEGPAAEVEASRSGPAGVEYRLRVAGGERALARLSSVPGVTVLDRGDGRHVRVGYDGDPEALGAALASGGLPQDAKPR